MKNIIKPYRDCLTSFLPGYPPSDNDISLLVILNQIKGMNSHHASRFRP
jgi:hypothetical protein